MRFCPEWVFSMIAALIAQRYLQTNLSLRAYSIKYAEILSERYATVPPDALEYVAEGMLRLMLEAEVEDAVAVLHGYSHFRVTTHFNGSPRKIRRVFTSQLDGLKQLDYDADKCVKIFKPYVYSLRMKPGLAAPPGWNWTRIEDGHWLCKMPEVEVSIFDGL